MILASYSKSAGLVETYYSWGVNRAIILLKLGLMGSSSLAAISMQVAAIGVSMFCLMDPGPIAQRYLSNKFEATNKVSGLYPFFS